jgi:hypothetical protein
MSGSRARVPNELEAMQRGNKCSMSMSIMSPYLFLLAGQKNLFLLFNSNEKLRMIVLLPRALQLVVQATAEFVDSS